MTIFENVFGIHENALKLRERRLNVLTENIANADTPNYKARDIDFKSVMRSTQAGMKDMTMTHGSHIDAAKAWQRRTGLSKSAKPFGGW